MPETMYGVEDPQIQHFRAGEEKREVDESVSLDEESRQRLLEMNESIAQVKDLEIRKIMMSLSFAQKSALDRAFNMSDYVSFQSVNVYDTFAEEKDLQGKKLFMGLLGDLARTKDPAEMKSMASMIADHLAQIV